MIGINVCHLSLVFGHDSKGVEDAGEGGFGPDAHDGVLVEEVVDPGDLGNLYRWVSRLMSWKFAIAEP